MRRCYVGLLILLYGISSTLPARENACFSGKNPLCEAITRLKPKITPREAMILSNHFHAVSLKYQLPPALLLAIAMQESGLVTERLRRVKGLILDVPNTRYDEGTVASDFCMMQIHVSNIKKLQLDPFRLLSDTRYCIEAGARILTEAKRHAGKEPEHWWSRYNAVNDIFRQQYRRLVLRYWRTIDPGESDPVPIQPGKAVP